MSNNKTLAGRRIAITGGARGIGLATAKELHARGAQVAIGDLDRDTAKLSAGTIAPEVVALGLDVSDETSFATFLDGVKDQLGGLDVLINNAGIMPIGPFLELDLAVARRTAEINFLGALIGTHLALPDMIAQGSGHVVNVASTAGRAAVPGGVTYCATKAAVVSLTEGARLEFGSRGIDFTCVMPSFTNTELIAGTEGTKGLKNVEPEDVAGAIAVAIEKKQYDVYRPKALRQILFTQGLLGRKIRDAMNRRLGAYDTFLKIDHSKRDGYDKRINAS
ncbi:MAG: Short-chain dehydrogenase [Marmoricola sp.]|nr:Short-chain dehydrogenase [Marmoricola sp.]